ncbi:amidohydrolase family protein [Simiduia aestuariiviva]|uniref:Amidohydrolase-related domain-containing protein n=1 Tax=Simiduia aestuariiviva TaxID=1510459 RepID=A0A839UKU7_9GAMM|nr:amidohydrolase family protein [Simiduia aestuariiviva]MBB3167391.1 hypothetical protein [Simiduia aestuariiviva]
MIYLKYMIVMVVFYAGAGVAISSEQSTYYKGPVIDAHLHAYSQGNPILGATHADPSTGRVFVGAKDERELKEETFKRLKKYNIVKAMMSTNEQWKVDNPKLFIHGYGGSYTVEEMREKHKLGLLEVIGEMAPNYHGLMPNDDQILPYFDLAEELDVPIAFHMYPGGPQGGAYSMFPKTRASHVKPLALEEILLKRPTMRIYIMHGGWPYLEDIKALMYAHPQVYVDIGVLSFTLPRSEVHNFLKSLVVAGFGKRIMFGSDQMVWPEIIDMAIEDVQTASFLSPEQKADIFYFNAARFFRLGEAEIARHHAVVNN